jgi:hypothetical protein
MNPWVPIVAGTVILGVSACGKTGPVDPPVCGTQTKLSEPGRRLQCGPALDFTPINSYQGEFAGVVQAREDAVALIDGRCTGTLIQASAGPVLLTAGHCVGLGDRSLLVFNFEDQPDGEPLIVEGTVIEQSRSPDYALIQLDTLPAVTPVPLTARASERLAIIQHPRGSRKVVAEGRFWDSCNQLIYYTDLDTLVGSSGAGVLTRDGHLLGIHTDGDCDEEGRGSNRGWTAEVIVHASAYLKSTDITER